ncbi:MotA/TolQ/ExbB proton channel family protein [Poseidonibacter antarcticus]|uniref:MotA/TolQ/ExbB proton channel family protein n=1 Tax=Poseidonibacter antarcticus TaxID=2478538 RepID=UPI000EF5057F|nr:MotA/TolQ/ExbB proton channel family protein [Poseidonibacter antarcticus]
MLTNEDFIDLNSKFYTTCRPVARIFNLLTIPTFLFALIILGYLELFPLKVEIHSVILIGFIYFIYLFFIKHNAYYVSCKFKTQYQELIFNLKNYINANLLAIGDTTKANGSADDFLKDYTSNIRNTNFSSIASGVFPTLGILGTFISIAYSMPDFSSGTSSALEKEISLLLGGVGTAFYVSIYGIFLSLWWTFFEKIGMSRFEHDCLIIRENTKSFFWTKIDIESINIKNNLENFKRMTDIFEQITSKDILDNINESIEKRVSILEDILEKETELSSSISQNIRNNEELSDNIKTMTLSISSSIASFEVQKQLHQTSTQDLNKNIGNLSKTLDNLSAKNLQEIYLNIIQSIETMKNETDKIGWKFHKELDEYDSKFSQRLTNSLESIDEQTVKIIEDLQEFKELSK